MGALESIRKIAGKMPWKSHLKIKEMLESFISLTKALVYFFFTLLVKIIS